MDRAVKPMLEVQGLRKVYEDASRTVEAIRDVSFSVGQGELVCIVGPSGAGKTTLLKCIAGLLAPTAGAGRGGRNAGDRSAAVHGGGVPGIRPQPVSVDERARQCGAAAEAEKDAAERREELVRNALAAVDLKGVDTAYPWQLSGGMQQRVAIARAVAYEPHVLLMDEPFAAVDAQTRADLEDLIRVLWHRLRVTVLFVTHDIDESVYLGQRVLVMSHAPTVIMEDVAIDLPEERTQLETRSMARFGELRKHIYSQIQLAKQGWRPPSQ